MGVLDHVDNPTRSPLQEYEVQMIFFLISEYMVCIAHTLLVLSLSCKGSQVKRECPFFVDIYCPEGDAANGTAMAASL